MTNKRWTQMKKIALRESRKGGVVTVLNQDKTVNKKLTYVLHAYVQKMNDKIK